MALALYDRVQQTGTANTTVSFNLTGAVTGFQSFTVVGNGNTTYYSATDTTGNWEVGIGTYSTTGPTLTRTTILSSSNSGAAVTFSGTVNVFVTYPSEKSVNLDAAGNITGYAISGGTIDNTVIGGTTPAAGTFTTITGQTEVLKGTGENLLLQSSNFASTWSLSSATQTTGQTDPFSGTTATLLNDGTTTGTHYVAQTITLPSNTYTISVYAKVGTANYLGIYNGGNGQGVIFNVSTGAFSANLVAAPASYSITNAGNGWYRCSITTIGTVSYVGFYMSEDGTSYSFTGTSKTVYIAAPQLEIGSVLNTYIPTTTTAVYGTPTLSFSGVAGLGLQSDGSLYVSPAGTGALQAQATTSSTVGGNARGANAVDWQTSRSNAARVASGSTSVISGGSENSAISALSFVGGGYNNSVSSSQTVTVGGENNTASGLSSAIVGGHLNKTTGMLNFIGGGEANSGTANAFVTQQAAATNGVTSGSTAVTLAASNAAIKVGQLVQGTGIQSSGSATNYTYVAAISGTSLTLSQNANASGTPTLSFYTPHGVVVGGGNNQATGSYSFIGGGGDAGTAANRNVASGDWSFVGGGWANKAVGNASSVVGGGINGSGTTAGNTANATSSYIGGGFANTVSINGFSSTIGGGSFNNTTASHTTIAGGRYGIDRGITGYTVFPACYQPITNASGVSQSALLIIAKQTTDATATVLTSDGAAASGTNQVILPNNAAYYFKASIISGVTGGGDTKGWTIEGVIKRGVGVGTTAIVGTVTTNIIAADAGASTWTVTATADTTNGGLAITFTGQASTTIRTVCQIRTTEMTY